MAQAGQYNYPRCIQRGDTGAAFLALHEFVEAGLSAIYLLNRKYMPFYKWAFRGTEQLTMLRSSVAALQKLSMPAVMASPQEVQSLIESICTEVTAELNRQGFSTVTDSFLSAHCGQIMAGIRDPRIKGLHVMADCD
jgi:hypothetical protein